MSHCNFMRVKQPESVQFFLEKFPHALVYTTYSANNKDTLSPELWLFLLFDWTNEYQVGWSERNMREFSISHILYIKHLYFASLKWRSISYFTHVANFPRWAAKLQFFTRQKLLFPSAASALELRAQQLQTVQANIVEFHGKTGLPGLWRVSAFKVRSPRRIHKIESHKIECWEGREDWIVA